MEKKIQIVLLATAMYLPFMILFKYGEIKYAKKPHEYKRELKFAKIIFPVLVLIYIIMVISLLIK